MDVNKILIPTDLSDESNAALNTANTFIDLFDCQVDLMHVIPISRYLSESFSSIGIPLNLEKDVSSKLIDKKKEELREVAEKHIKNPEKKGKAIVSIDRKPWEAIVKKAEKDGYDLILMSAKGHHQSEFFHGSITGKIVRKSTVPVLTLSKFITSDHVNDILVPCDFSNHSLSALPVAFELALKFGAKIQVLNVVELYAAEVHGVTGGVAGVETDSVYNGLMNRLKDYFNTLDGEYSFSIETGEEEFENDIIRTDKDGNSDKVSFQAIVSRAVAAHHQIVDVANSNADMMVMSTHGRTGLSHMLLGSTTEQVVQQVKIPQLTIKPDLED